MKTKKQKRFKVYLSLYKDGKRIEIEEIESLVSRLIKEYPIEFQFNKNKTQDRHYPLYYDDVYYFGDPFVLTAIREDKLKGLLEYFKSNGFSWWIPHLYRMISFQELKEEFKLLTDLEMEDNNLEWRPIFTIKCNLVNEYKDGRAVIQQETEINKIIEVTK